MAILAYIPLSAVLGADQQTSLAKDIITPLLKQFANAMMMVGAPVTLFSMVKNLTDIYIVSKKNSSGRKLQMKTVATSIIMIFLAFATSLFVYAVLNSHAGNLGAPNTLSANMNFSEFISNIVPSSIFEPFETYMPFPMIIVALLISYAFCSIGKYFNVMQKIIDVCYTLFGKMLNVVMFTLPLFFFLSILSSLLADGFSDLLLFVRVIVIVLLSLIVIFGFYLIRLLIGGVKIIPFVKHMPSLIW